MVGFKTEMDAQKKKDIEKIIQSNCFNSKGSILDEIVTIPTRKEGKMKNSVIQCVTTCHNLEMG